MCFHTQPFHLDTETQIQALTHVRQAIHWLSYFPTSVPPSSLNINIFPKRNVCKGTMKGWVNKWVNDWMMAPETCTRPLSPGCLMLEEALNGSARPTKALNPQWLLLAVQFDAFPISKKTCQCQWTLNRVTGMGPLISQACECDTRKLRYLSAKVLIQSLCQSLDLEWQDLTFCLPSCHLQRSLALICLAFLLFWPFSKLSLLFFLFQPHQGLFYWGWGGVHWSVVNCSTLGGGAVQSLGTKGQGTFTREERAEEQPWEAGSPCPSTVLCVCSLWLSHSHCPELQATECGLQLWLRARVMPEG